MNTDIREAGFNPRQPRAQDGKWAGKGWGGKKRKTGFKGKGKGWKVNKDGWGADLRSGGKRQAVPEKVRIEGLVRKAMDDNPKTTKAIVGLSVVGGIAAGAAGIPLSIATGVGALAAYNKIKSSRFKKKEARVAKVAPLSRLMKAHRTARNKRAREFKKLGGLKSDAAKKRKKTLYKEIKALDHEYVKIVSTADKLLSKGKLESEK